MPSKSFVSVDNDALKSRYEKFLSKQTAKRVPLDFMNGSIPIETKIHKNPIPLAYGLPNDGFFPIESVHMNVMDEPFGHKKYDFQSSRIHKVPLKGDDDWDELKYIEEKLRDGSMVNVWRYQPDEPMNLCGSQSFQYADTKGFPQLLNFVKDVTERINTPAYDNWDVTLANGSSDALFKIMEVLCDCNSTILFEEFSFTPVLSSLYASKTTPIPLKLEMSSDSTKQGIDIEYMIDLLENWYSGPYSHLQKPKAFYTIPNGHNPTNSTLSNDKKTAIMELAEKHDFLIIEDDPYGYLAYHKFDVNNPFKNLYKESEITDKEYCEELIAPSFLKFDTTGRVLRLETFSKMFIPGLRLSFIVGNSFLIDRILTFAKATTGQPSGISQLVFYNVVQSWSREKSNMVEGWLSWLKKVAKEYTDRRNYMYHSLYDTTAYKKGFLSFSEGSHGMFIGLYINLENMGPLTGEQKIQKMNLLNKLLLEEGCICVLGYKMAVDHEFSRERGNFLRLTYSFAPDNDTISLACSRLSSAVEKLFQEQDI